MTLMLMPCSVWGIFVASILALLAFPALFVACIMMLLASIAGTSFFMPAIMAMGKEDKGYEGGSPHPFQHLFWFFGHPAVYIVALPAFVILPPLVIVYSPNITFPYLISYVYLDHHHTL